MKITTYAFISSLIFFASQLMATFSCPPFPNLRHCIDAAGYDKASCISDMREYFSDKDNLADKYYPYYMITFGCHDKYISNMYSCESSCN